MRHCKRDLPWITDDPSLMRREAWWITGELPKITSDMSQMRRYIRLISCDMPQMKGEPS